MPSKWKIYNSAWIVFIILHSRKIYFFQRTDNQCKQKSLFLPRNWDEVLVALSCPTCYWNLLLNKKSKCKIYINPLKYLYVYTIKIIMYYSYVKYANSLHTEKKYRQYYSQMLSFFPNTEKSLNLTHKHFSLSDTSYRVFKVFKFPIKYKQQ